MNKTVCPKSWVSALFKKIQARYGHKWTSCIDGIEDIAVAEWSETLGGLTGEQIKHGLDTWNGDWPPSAPEFKNACLGKGQNEFGLGYIPEYHREANRVPHDKRLSSDERDTKREKARSTYLPKLKEALSSNST